MLKRTWGITQNLFRDYLVRQLWAYLSYGIFKDYLENYIKPTMGLVNNYPRKHLGLYLSYGILGVT